MKTAILTLPLHTNYGGILQCYALQTVLECMGHEVKVLDKKFDFKLPLYRYPLAYAKRIVFKYLLCKKGVDILKEQKLRREYAVVSQYTQPFIKRYIRAIYVPLTTEQMQKEGFQAFVVGSDQVWRPKYFNSNLSLIHQAYLSFTEGLPVKRLSYAASFGTDDWEYTPRQTEQCKALLLQFDGVSVRERGAVALCREHFGREALHVLDPTMLLTAADYRQLIAQSPEQLQPVEGLMTYILDSDSEKEAVAQRIAEHNGWSIFRGNSRCEDLTAPLTERIQPPVEQWLQGFAQAQMILTDSFHACVFSILFHKPFVVIGNAARGLSRFHSLLSLFGLESRLVTSAAEAERVAAQPICWETVDSRLEEERIKSMAFLKQHLGEV